MSLLHRASFFTSAARLDQLPTAGAPEVCFVGRSNAGKSTAINVLCNQRRLAFSSKTPGRTRLINMFGLPDPLDPEGHIGFLVDLPGYGYASVARDEKEKWADILGGYLRDRESLVGIVLLIDIRRGVTELDRRLANFIAPTGRPVLALLTKPTSCPTASACAPCSPCARTWPISAPCTPFPSPRPNASGWKRPARTSKTGFLPRSYHEPADHLP